MAPSPDSEEHPWPDALGKSLGTLVADIIGCFPCTGKAPHLPDGGAEISTQRSLPAGVGLIFELCVGDNLRVHCVLPGSDAGLKGVAVGDFLQEVNGVVVATDLKEARACLYGDAGTTVQLTFKRLVKETGSFHFYTVDVVRRPTGSSLLQMGGFGGGGGGAEQDQRGSWEDSSP